MSLSLSVCFYICLYLPFSLFIIAWVAFLLSLTVHVFAFVSVSLRSPYRVNRPKCPQWTAPRQLRSRSRHCGIVALSPACTPLKSACLPGTQDLWLFFHISHFFCLSPSYSLFLSISHSLCAAYISSSTFCILCGDGCQFQLL